MNFSSDHNANINNLTAREREVLFLRTEGLTREQIAETLQIAETTAKTHLQNIHRKLGVSTQAELIKLVYSQRKA
ncbi:MAG: helix-turn-helix transcriptional regulator [SAR324 cluster bacterium]|uniref:Helix-turn-helix transcriptional regulator n=1 Tax=SAR324 cluster bacterium TaxID=2024889 RepID=A0A7X9IJQ2_9DELT|nr:helix-turn-helix transcriptional regulator [SAR324 cluster bacterium]